MSSTANVELIERFYDAWRRRDLDAVVACVHPEMEFDWLNARGPFRGTYRGHEGLGRFFEDLTDAWDRFVPEVEEVVECGPDRLVAVSVVHARGRGSGIEVDARGGLLYTVRDGRILSGIFFQTRDEALDAAARASAPG